MPQDSPTVQAHPKDVQHIPEKLLKGTQLMRLKTSDRQEKPSQKGRVLYRNSSLARNPSCKAEEKHSKIHLTASCQLTSLWRKQEAFTPPSCRTTCQDTQIITLRLFFLQKTRPFPEYWLAVGKGIFITWVTISEILQETGKCLKFFKGRLCETLGFHKTCTYQQETFCVVDSCQEVPVFSFIWVLNHSPGAFWTGENTVLEYEHNINKHNEKLNSVFLQ